MARIPARPGPARLLAGSEVSRVGLRFAALAIALVVAACGPSGPKLPKLGAGDVVLAFGDSLTHGTGAAAADAYPAVLEALIGRKVVGAGIPGEVSEAGLARLPGAIDEAQPRLLLLCHGGNDFLRKNDDARTRANVRAMVQLARERGIDVVLLATPKPGFGIVVPKFYEEIAREFGVPVEAAVLETVLTDKSLKSDLVHPNAKGYRRVAEAVAELLRRSGAI